MTGMYERELNKINFAIHTIVFIFNALALSVDYILHLTKFSYFKT